MLFLGTKKYPDENTYSKFIQAHGGSKNAATGELYTYFYFNI
jgi:insulysin